MSLLFAVALSAHGGPCDACQAEVDRWKGQAAQARSAGGSASCGSEAACTAACASSPIACRKAEYYAIQAQIPAMEAEVAKCRQGAPSQCGAATPATGAPATGEAAGSVVAFTPGEVSAHFDAAQDAAAGARGAVDALRLSSVAYEGSRGVDPAALGVGPTDAFASAGGGGGSDLGDLFGSRAATGCERMPQKPYDPATQGLFGPGCSRDGWGACLKAGELKGCRPLVPTKSVCCDAGYCPSGWSCAEPGRCAPPGAAACGVGTAVPAAADLRIARGCQADTQWTAVAKTGHGVLALWKRRPVTGDPGLCTFDAQALHQGTERVEVRFQGFVVTCGDGTEVVHAADGLALGGVVEPGGRSPVVAWEDAGCRGADIRSVSVRMTSTALP